MTKHYTDPNDAPGTPDAWKVVPRAGVVTDGNPFWWSLPPWASRGFPLYTLDNHPHSAELERLRVYVAELMADNARLRRQLGGKE